ncbi:VPLPA-CTERM sorting domain-containing protein [Sneathiella sp. CAU 1612]|uniref:VPLPA-CTERM sorting domain-containing protein n=1 Tax=Sneathiella sedimenti TaxID=2816034 RepID=A0ABS3F9D4_9PROT|nr:VPLPA-CTERM sorting domain-containing protein [Sneathiella sedimenti]MBO0334937.1 VPLPA-CTERM sorting domain-containing protein [Sneathiella sedimenti]
MIRILILLACLLPFSANASIIPMQITFNVPDSYTQLDLHSGEEFTQTPRYPSPFLEGFYAKFEYDNEVGAAGSRSIQNVVFYGTPFAELFQLYNETYARPFATGEYDKTKNSLNLSAFYNDGPRNSCPTSDFCSYFGGYADFWISIHASPDGRYSEVVTNNFSDFDHTRSGTYSISAVPLPAALPLFGAGLLAFGLFRKFKKSA